MNKITISAPGKLMLLGEHAVVYNHPCLVTTVDQRIKTTVELISEPIFVLQASDVKVIHYKKSISDIGKGDIPKGAKFVEMVVANFLNQIPKQVRNEKLILRTVIPAKAGIQKSTRFPIKSGMTKMRNMNDNMGVRVTTKSEFSSQFGFGSSSAATVCVVKGLSELFNIKLSQREIFDLSYKTVLDVQGKGSGFDVAAAVFGGTLYFVTGGKVIESLDIESLRLVVGYSGIKADTATLINKVKEAFSNRQDRLAEIYSGIEMLVKEAKDALIKRDWERLGELMNKNQEYLSELGVSSDKLDSMIKSALDAGAYGAKLSGAGGGDCMITISSEEKKQAVENSIIKAGGEIISVKTNVEGVRVEND